MCLKAFGNLAFLQLYIPLLQGRPTTPALEAALSEGTIGKNHALNAKIN
jgi:hypothetical protein